MFSQVKFHINYITKRLDLSIYIYVSISLYQALHIKPDQSYEKILTQRSNSEKKMTKYENTCKPKIQGFIL